MQNASDQFDDEGQSDPGPTAYLLQEMQLYGYRPLDD
jgi:hypothetical protein